MTRKEAIDKVYGMIGTAEQHEALDFLVPEIRELRESYDRQQKDERIRKEILSALKFANVGGIYNEHIAYLERQKPVDYEAELKKCKDNPLYFFDKYVSIKQKSTEWSESDKQNINLIISYLDSYIKEHNDTFGADECKSFKHWLKFLPERFNLQPKEEQSKYDGNMDKECIKLCNTLNSIPSVNTFESCCGHLKDSYSVWFFCNDIIAISRLGRCVERNYSDGKWELLVDSTDTHPTGVFWLRSKVPFQSYDEMEESVNELCVCIQYWFNTKFDSYFNDDACK